VFEPRKNVPLLVDAFEILRHTRPEAADLQLALAGGPGWRGEEIAAAVRRRGLEPAARLLGYVPDADLPALYRGATLAVVRPSTRASASPRSSHGLRAPVLAADAAALRRRSPAPASCSPRGSGLLAATIAALAADPPGSRACASGVGARRRLQLGPLRGRDLAVYREAAGAR